MARLLYRRKKFYSRFSHLIRFLWLSPLALNRLVRHQKRLVTSIFVICLFTLTACLGLLDFSEVRVVLSAGFPVDAVAGASLLNVLQDDLTGKLPEKYQQDITDRVSRGHQSVRLLSLSNGKPSCPSLIQGDLKEIKYAKQYMESVEFPREPGLGQMTEAPLDCEAYIKQRGFIMHAAQEELDFPIAYGLLLYRDMDQAERLLRSIYRPHNHYCIHIDAKTSPHLQKAMQGIAKCLPNVVMSSKQNRVDWAGFNSLTPHMYCMGDLWSKAWKYYINLTGQEFPLKTNWQMVRILKALGGSNVVDSTEYSGYHDRWYNNLPAPDNIRPQKGLVFVLASRGMVDYILHDPVSQRLLEWISLTDYPDETFFSSLNGNPHLQVPGSYNGKAIETHAVEKPYIARFVNWGGTWKDRFGRSPFSWPCGGKRVRGVCIFGVADLPLLTDRKELFANKFYMDYEPLALSCLEEWHFNLTLAEYSGLTKIDTSWYAKLDIVKSSVNKMKIPSNT